MVNYLSFALSALLIGPFVVQKPDVLYVFNLITLAWTALLIKKVSGCKIIYDVQDLWPESVSNSGMLTNRAIQGILKRWSCWAYRQADKIAVLSPGFKNALVQRGVDPGRIEVIYNWSEETKDPHNGSGNSLKETYHLQHTFNVVFAGTMGVMQGLDTVLEAARLGGDQIPELRFVLVGGGVELERLKEKAVQSGLKNVVFIPRQPMSEMHRIWALADALLVHLVDDPLFEITIPSKTQAYLAAGIPIVMGVRGDAADLVHSAGAGVACAPENPEEMLAAIKQLVAMTPEERKQMGRNGKAFYERFLSFEAGGEKFLRLIS